MKKIILNIDIIKNYLELGFSCAKIAKKLNCSGSTISEFCRKNNLQSKHQFHKHQNLTGQIFGYITVFESLGRKLPDKYPSANIWKCQCKCGKIMELPTYHIKKTVSCGCLLKEKNYIINHNPTWKGYQEISSTYFSRIKREARDRQIEFLVTIEEIWDLFISQNRKCKLSGLDLCFKFGEQEQTASLDRIDSNQPYVNGNIQWVHKNVNIMKACLQQQEFITLCRAVAINNQGEL